jgi:hypothetical protein
MFRPLTARPLQECGPLALLATVASDVTEKEKC